MPQVTEAKTSFFLHKVSRATNAEKGTPQFTSLPALKENLDRTSKGIKYFTRPNWFQRSTSDN